MLKDNLPDDDDDYDKLKELQTYLPLQMRYASGRRGMKRTDLPVSTSSAP